MRSYFVTHNKGANFMNLVIIVTSLILIALFHYIYAFLFRRVSRKMSFTKICSCFSMYYIKHLCICYSSQYVEDYASRGADLTILVVMIVSFGSLLIMIGYLFLSWKLSV